LSTIINGIFQWEGGPDNDITTKDINKY